MAPIPEGWDNPQTAQELAARAGGDSRGIRCRGCGATGPFSSSVYRTTPGDDRIVRIRECLRCHHKQITDERPR